ncbi:MAG: carbohydrate ABC transporter permease [Actinomycetaceae bacterium]|nr:carbohydrate ABC transporter permease [Actinomycetaceae bacterium]MDY6083459.1 carbohydrate ABC transporter permease [Actinomycetaceae bacterium]
MFGKKKEAESFTYEPPRSFAPSKLAKVLTTVVLVIVLVYFLFPIYWLVISSTKTNAEMVSSNGLWFASSLSELPDAIAANYSKLLGLSQNQFWRWVGNSLFYAGTAAVVGTLIATMAGYALAKFNFRGKNVVYGLIMAGLLMPAALLTIPMYVVFSKLGLTDTMISIIIPCMVSPFGVFLGRVYAQSSVPSELLDAARIDGASEARVFFTIVMRILAPAMVTIFLFIFVATWNNFLLPLMMVSSNELQPVTLGLYGALSQNLRDYGPVLLGALLGVIPLIVLFLGLQRYWQSGLAAGSVKE